MICYIASHEMQIEIDMFYSFTCFFPSMIIILGFMCFIVLVLM